MAVTLKQQKDGATFRPCWYGVYTVDGKRTVINTGVKWQGTPPASGSLRDPGDAAFEATREKAEGELARYRDEANRKGNAAHLVERLIEAKTGRAVSHVRIDELGERWRNLARDSKPGVVYVQACNALFRRFTAFMHERSPAAVYLYEVSPEHAAGFAMACRESLAPATARTQIQRLRSAFSRFLPAGVLNPFEDLVRKAASGSGDTMHRRPFTPEELQALIDEARDDEFMFPLIVTAMCTGLRRGDVCRLRWPAVDFDGGMLAVKTNKSGAKVEIPMFQPLREVLESRTGNGSPFVFPAAERMLAENPDGLTWRFKKIVAAALDTSQPAATEPPPVDPAEIEEDALAAIRANVKPGARRDRMLAVMHLYAAGRSYRDIEAETGIPRPMLCGDFQAVQDMIGRTFIRGAHKTTDCKRAIARVTREARPQGTKSASVRDWHALRVTFCTIALSAGVPMELVRKITGHATTEIVLTHYFKPGRDDFKAALMKALPDVMTGAKAARQLTAGDELAGLAAKVQAGTATDADKARLRKLAAKV